MEKRREYDIIVVGSGAGLLVANRALMHGYRVALVEKSFLGGTCLNVGCIPSKMLIYPADVVALINDVNEREELGIKAEIRSIDFAGIMQRMRDKIKKEREKIKQAVEKAENLDFYPSTASFVDDYMLEVKDKNGSEIVIKGDRIFIANGARPAIPKIKGIENVSYLTNETLLELREKPNSMITIGGGYIAAEYAHFFSAMGTEVTILERGNRLLKNEEPEISELFMQEISKRVNVNYNVEIMQIKEKGKSIEVKAKNGIFEAESLLVATGRKPNSDLLKPEKSGVKTDAKGFIIVNEYLETTKKKIFAFGDIIGKQMFRHVANREALIAWHNAMHGDGKVAVDYSAAPHAVFTHPQIASVGLKESEAVEKYGRENILVGRAKYNSVAKGEAMSEDKAFAKAIVHKQTMKILGFHIIGPFAPILIQEVVAAIANKGDVSYIANAMHIHPAMPEIVVETFANLKEA